MQGSLDQSLKSPEYVALGISTSIPMQTFDELPVRFSIGISGRLSEENTGRIYEECLNELLKEFL